MKTRETSFDEIPDPIAESALRIKNLPYSVIHLNDPDRWTEAPIAAFMETTLRDSTGAADVSFSSVALSYVPASWVAGTEDKTDVLRYLSKFTADATMWWEAVRTAWRPVTLDLGVKDELDYHIHHVTRNRFRHEPSIEVIETDPPVDTLMIDGVEHGIDLALTNGLVLGVGVLLANTVLTLVVPVSALPGLKLSLTSGPDRLTSGPN